MTTTSSPAHQAFDHIASPTSLGRVFQVPPGCCGIAQGETAKYGYIGALTHNSVGIAMVRKNVDDAPLIAYTNIDAGTVIWMTIDALIADIGARDESEPVEVFVNSGNADLRLLESVLAHLTVYAQDITIIADHFAEQWVLNLQTGEVASPTELADRHWDLMFMPPRDAVMHLGQRMSNPTPANQAFDLRTQEGPDYQLVTQPIPPGTLPALRWTPGGN